MSADPVGSPRFSDSWLALREPADAAARSRDLAALAALAVRSVRTADGGGPARLVVHDLGCGSGSMGRWLAPLLPGPQHWVLHDQDDDLLAVASARTPTTAADGAPVTVETRRTDVSALAATDLAGAGLVTASALLDLLTSAEVDLLVAAVVATVCPALLTLSVVGRVELDPADGRDGAVQAAFNAHQRRAVDGRRLLGPDAAATTDGAFRAHGHRVVSAPSPWRLGPGSAALGAAWLSGWAGAAAQERPDVVPRGWTDDRVAAAAAGRLTATVHHVDLLALPPGA